MTDKKNPKEKKIEEAVETAADFATKELTEEQLKTVAGGTGGDKNYDPHELPEIFI